MYVIQWDITSHVRMIIIKKKKMRNAGKGVEKMEPLYTVGGM